MDPWQIQSDWQYTTDSLLNLVSHVGDDRDKRAYNQFKADKLVQQELEAAYQCWLPAKVVDIIPNRATSRWREIYFKDSDPDEFLNYSNQIGVKGAFRTGDKWGRLFGGAGIYMVFDGDDPATPLDIESVSKNKPLRRLVVFDRYDVNVMGINRDAGAANFLRPEVYQFPEARKTIHWTRVLGPIDGYRLPNRLQIENMGWGGSVTERTADIVLDAMSAPSSLCSLLHKADVDAIGVSGLLSKTANSTLTSQLARRFALAQKMMSNNSFLLYDKEKEELSKHSIQLSNVSGVIPEMISLVAAATGIPITEFYGTAPKGLNATGEGDRKQLQALIKDHQTTVYDPLLSILDRIICRSVYGRDMDMEYNWAPIEDMSEKEMAEAANLRASTANTYVLMGAVQVSHVSQELLSSGEYSALDQEYIDALKIVEGTKDDPNDRPEQTQEEDTSEQTPEDSADTPIS